MAERIDLKIENPNHNILTHQVYPIVSANPLMMPSLQYDFEVTNESMQLSLCQPWGKEDRLRNMRRRLVRASGTIKITPWCNGRD